MRLDAALVKRGLAQTRSEASRMIDAGNVTVAGTIVASGDITAFSDERLKHNINRIENALDKTLHLNGVTFETKENKKSLGVWNGDTINTFRHI